jgi:hypothetical protein
VAPVGRHVLRRPTGIRYRWRGWGDRWASWARTELRAQLAHRRSCQVLPAAGDAPAGGWPGPGHMRRIEVPPLVRPCTASSCTRAASDTVVQTPQVARLADAARGREAGGDSGRDGGPAANRLRRTRAALRAAGGPAHNLGRNQRPTAADGPSGGSGGVVPPGKYCEPSARPERAEHRATPGGYGGKPPGVAIIGVPTGARNAGRCSDGGPEHQLECYYDSHHDAYNPDTFWVVCACSAALQNVVSRRC